MTTFCRMLTVATLALTVADSRAQDYYKTFVEHLNNGDSLAQVTLLRQWKQDNSNDPELYVGWFNFYVMQARQELLNFNFEPPAEGEYLELTPTEDSLYHEQADSTGPAAYLFSDIYYDPYLIDTAMFYIDTAIQRWPDRLDLRFGKIHIAGEIGDYDLYTREICSAISYSEENNNQWLWSLNEPLKDGKDFMLGNVQTYQYSLFDTQDDNLLPHIDKISSSVLKLYPDHVESMSNLSVIAMIREDYDGALIQLLAAYEIAPKDPIILANIAHCYRMKGALTNARKFYTRMKKFGDRDQKEYAEAMLMELELEGK